MRVIYLHGFLSSPSSFKAELMRKECEKRGIEFFAPDLNVAPEDAVARALSFADGVPSEELFAVGSSLGGFYATRIAEMLECRAVLINPAVHPWKFVKDYAGEQPVYGTDRTVFVSPDYETELLRLASPVLMVPERYLVLLSEKDEVLDWREAAEKYGKARQIRIPDGDHRVSNFEKYCSAAADFFYEDYPREH